MPGESVKDMVVRLSFEHGDTKQQISAITNELKLLDSGFAASAAVAAGFSGGLNQTGAAADQLRQKLSVQQQLVAKYGQAIEQANERLQKSIATHAQQGQKLDELKGKFAEEESGIKAMEAGLKELEDEGMKNTSVYAEMAAQLDQLKATHKETGDAVKQQEAAYARSDKAISRNEQAIQKLTIKQNEAKAAMAQTEAALQKEETRLQHNAAAWETAAAAAGKFAKQAKGAGEWQTKAGKTLTKASTAIVGLGVAAGKAAIDWESSFAGVRKTVNGTEEELQGINDALLSMEVPTDFADLADIAANAGQLGIATENVVGFTRTMADLAETTDLTADAAASSFAQYANITQMPQENIGRLGSVTVELGNNLATTESKIVAFAQAIGAAGSQAGMTDQQIFGISGGLASLGLEAQAGGTAFSKALISMKVAAETGNEDLAAFAKVAGMSAEEFKASFGQDAAGTFIRFVQGLSSGSESAIVMLDKMGITETRLRDMLLRSSNASTLLTKSVSLANQAWTENSALANEAAVRYGTTESRMKMTAKQAQRAAMDFGKALMPALNQGLDGIQGVIDRFNQLDDAQRAGIVKWAAYAAAVGPALTVLGKANTAMSGVASGFSSLASAMATGGLNGFVSSLSGLLGPAGIAALVAGLGLAAYKLYDYASGAKAAREAQAALNEQARQWLDTQADTLYDTGNSNPLARFGLTPEDFAGSETAAQDWMDSLMATWTDGKAETNQILKEYVDGFKKGSDDVRGAIEGQSDLLSEYGALTPEAKANLDADLKQLDAYDQEVAALLKKRQNGMLSDEDQARLNEIIQARAQIQMKYELDTDGYDQIVTQMRAEIERLKAAGQDGGDPQLMGDTLNALADGRKAYMDALNASYDAEYANIQQIEDEGARQAALNALNERYNEQRMDGEEAYADAVREAGAAAMENGDWGDQLDTVNKLMAELGKGGEMDLPKISELTEGLDEGQLTSIIALMEQLKAAGMTDEEMTLGFGENLDSLKAKIEAIRDISKDTEGLEGLSEAIGKALPEEIQRIMVGLDMTQAATDWATFAEGGSLQKIRAGVEPDTTQTIELTGTINEIDLGPGATFEVDGDGNVTGVTTATGLTFDVDGEGNITRVTTPSGVTIDARGNVKDVDWPEDAEYVVDGEGNITGVTLADGTTFAVDGSGSIVNVTVARAAQVPQLSATASVTLNPLDQAAVAAWKEANSGVTLEGPPAKVGVKLGANWKSELETALDAGLLTVTSNGVPVTVTPEVLRQITAQDVALIGEDGTIHVIVTPDVGTPEGVEQADAAMNQNPNAGTILAPLSSSTQEKVDQIKALSASIEDYRKSAEAAKKMGDFDESAIFSSEAVNESQLLAKAVEGLSDADLENIGGQIANLMAALEGGEGTPEQLEQYRQQLGDLLALVGTIDPGAFNVTGSGVMEGIAQGMAAYGWSGDAGTVSSAIQSAINAALQINSPSKVMNPTGEGVAEGIGQGMGQYDFSSDAGGVAGSIISAFGDKARDAADIGKQFSAGLAGGIISGRSRVIEAAKSVAQAAAQAAKAALDIHSPSKVTEGFGEMFDLGFVRGIENELPRISRAVEAALYPAPPRQSPGTVVNQSTDNRDMSVSAPIQVAHMEVRDDSDIDSISTQLAAMVRLDQKLIGAR